MKFSHTAALAAFGLLLTSQALAQLRLPQLPSLPNLPRPLERAIAPLPELLPTTTALVDQRLAAVRELLAQHGDRIEADPAGAPIRRRELVLVSPDDAALAEAARLGLTVLREEGWPELGLREVVLAVPEGLATAEGLQRLRAAQPALQADFNHLYLRSGALTETAATATMRADTPTLGTGRGLRVGLIDGGVDFRHAALRRVTPRTHGCEGEQRPSDHGTAVASLLVGQDRRFRGALPTPEVALFAADVYCDRPDGGAADEVVRALAWMARERVGVINLSLVGPPNALLARGVAALVERGHLLVAAVGNDGPAAPPLYPASYAGVIGVTGVGPSRRVLPEAAQGAQVLLAAPGASLAVAQRGGGYSLARGTSFAAPWVAGLLAAELPAPDVASAAAALQRLIASARDLGVPGRDPVYGHGLVAEDLPVPPERLQDRPGR